MDEYLSYEEVKKQWVEAQKNTHPIPRDVNNPVEMVTIVKEKDKEDKEYLLCIEYYSDDNSDKEWLICKGRTEAYEYLKDIINIIDTELSFVLVENLPLDKRVSVYKFMKFVQDSYNDGFDIDYELNDNSEFNNDDYSIPSANSSEFNISDVINGTTGMVELN